MKTVLLEQNKAANDERVQVILQGLAAGKTREELAEEIGNTNWKSVDMYMRRRNFTWDSQLQNYVPKIEPIKQDFSTDSSKAGHVRSLFQKEGADAKTIAERLGFQDHRELAKYMNVRGFVWDSKQGNYVKKVGELPVLAEEEKVEETKSTEPAYPQNREEASGLKAAEGDLERFLPILELLNKHQERLLDILTPASKSGTIPRFIVPGIAKTKTVQMMNTIEQLVVDFSREKNISQRELFEVALIEFFRNYGYEQEIERLLSR